MTLPPPSDPVQAIREKIDQVRFFAVSKSRQFTDQAFGDSRVEEAAMVLEDVALMLGDALSALGSSASPSSPTASEGRAIRLALAALNRFDVVPCGHHDHRDPEGAMLYFCPWCERDAFEPEHVRHAAKLAGDSFDCPLIAARRALTEALSTAGSPVPKDENR